MLRIKYWLVLTILVLGGSLFWQNSTIVLAQTSINDIKATGINPAVSGASQVGTDPGKCSCVISYNIANLATPNKNQETTFETVCKSFTGGGVNSANKMRCVGVQYNWSVSSKTGTDCKLINITWFDSIVRSKLGTIFSSVNDSYIQSTSFICAPPGSSGSTASTQMAGNTVCTAEEAMTTSGLVACAKRELNPGGITSPLQLLGYAIKFNYAAMGAIAFALYLWAGFLFMTSGGNAERRGKAMKTFLWVTLAVIVLFSSYAILKFVFSSLIMK